MDYKEKLKEALNSDNTDYEVVRWIEQNFPELKESEDELTWLKRFIKEEIDCLSIDIRDDEDCIKLKNLQKSLAWLEKQGESYTKRDVDDAYLRGVTNTKNEIEKQYEANYQIRKDIATFIFNYKGDIKDRAKWMDYLGIKVSFVEKQGEKNPADKVEPKFKAGDVMRTLQESAEWSDVDNRLLDDVILAINSMKEWGHEDRELHINFIKSVKNRVQPQLQPNKEWSEEDEGMIEDIIFELEENQEHISGVGYKIDWLKDLKDRAQPQSQNAWKPSDLQIKALEYYTKIGCVDKEGFFGSELVKLLEELKKL